jgi:phosphate transport system substrate-binding protein
MFTMIRVRNTLAVLAFTTLLGCAVDSPASTPTTQQLNVTLYSTYATQPLTQTLTDHYIESHPEFSINVMDSSYDDLMTQITKGSADYFMSSYVPSDDDIWVAPIARDGLVAVVHPDIPISNLKVDELHDIFSGHITQWKSLGGNDATISPLTFQINDDISKEFNRLIMGQQGITSNAQVIPSIKAMIQQVSTTPNTIGYIPLSHVTESVKILSIDDIYPNQSTMTNNVYPLRITLFIIGRDEPPTTYRTFFSWIQSDEGQAIVAQNYISLP